jgi:tetratricopeptide (TPR) repeat protein
MEDVASIEFMVRNVVPENQILRADCVHQVRLVKNHPQIRFEGKVHNQIRRNLDAHREKSGELNVRTNAEIFHVGYALEKEKKKQKYRERLHLLEHEVENARDAVRRAYYQYQLGNAYFMLERLEDVVETLDQVNYVQLGPVNGYFTHFMHAYACASLGEYGEALKHAEEMIALNDKEPAGYMMTGEALKFMGRGEAALAMLIKTFDLNEEGRGQIRFELDEAYLFFLIAQLAAKLGYMERAQFFAAKYNDEYPDDEKGNVLLDTINQHLEERKKIPTS